jgi:hypothetical protein
MPLTWLNYGIFMPHHSCENHGAALQIGVFETIAPPGIGQQNINQLMFQTFYICNEDWAMIKAQLKVLLRVTESENDFKDLINAFPGKSFIQRQAAAISGIQKPDAPLASRWGTLKSSVFFLCSYEQALRKVFFEVMSLGGNKPNAIEKVCFKCVEMFFCPQIMADLYIMRDFIDFYWNPFVNNIISLKDRVFNVQGCFTGHLRPAKVYSQLQTLEGIISNKAYKNYPSYQYALKSRNGDDVAASTHVARYYEEALLSVKRNGLRYLSSPLVLCGLADIKFAPIVFEAVSRFKKCLPRGVHHTVAGTRILKELTDGYDKLHDMEKQFLQDMLKLPRIKEMRALVELANSDSQAFVQTIKEAKSDNVTTFFLRR